MGQGRKNLLNPLNWNYQLSFATFQDEDKKVVQCRYDWHQTATNVVVAVYAKKYHYAQSFVEVNPIRLHVSLVFPEQENAKFDLDLELRGVSV